MFHTGSGATKEHILISFIKKDLSVEYLSLDLGSKKTQQLDRQAMTGYPTSILSPIDNNLYYTSIDSENSTQLFSYNLKTKKRKQLTSDFANVDYLRIDKERQIIYMRVLLKGYRNFHIASYDIKNKTINIWNHNEKDMSVRYFDYDEKTNQVITFEFSQSEDYNNLEKSNKLKLSYVIPTSYHLTLYKGSSQKVKSVSTVKKNLIDVSVASGANQALFSASDVFSEDAKNTIYRVYLKTGSITPLLSDQNKYSRIKQPQYSTDEKGFYFLAQKTDENYIADKTGAQIKPTVLCYYDFNTSLVSEIWRNDGGAINNYLLLR